jgi:hypothetical protein
MMPQIISSCSNRFLPFGTYIAFRAVAPLAFVGAGGTDVVGVLLAQPVIPPVTAIAALRPATFTNCFLFITRKFWFIVAYVSYQNKPTRSVKFFGGIIKTFYRRLRNIHWYKSD